MTNRAEAQAEISTPHHEHRKKIAKEKADQQSENSRVVGERIDIVVTKGPTGKTLQKVCLITVKEKMDKDKSILSEYSWYVGRIGDPSVDKYLADWKSSGKPWEFKYY